MKKLVATLQSLPDDFKNRNAWENINLPPYLHPGFKISFFTSVIMIASYVIPELRAFYTHEEEYEPDGHIILKPDCNYDYNWFNALSMYLEDDFIEWSADYGIALGDYGDLGKEGCEPLYNYHIINQLVDLCARYDEMTKTIPKDTTTITGTAMTMFYVFYSFSMSKHNHLYSLFSNMFFDMFVVGCLMIGKHLNYKYIDIIQFIALPITISILLITYKHFRYEEHFSFYLALIVLLINGFCIATVFSSKPMKLVRRFLKGIVDFWQAEDVEFENKTNNKGAIK